jgi:hypothetical protein
LPSRVRRDRVRHGTLDHATDLHEDGFAAFCRRPHEIREEMTQADLEVTTMASIVAALSLAISMSRLKRSTRRWA